jgi:hypothetical protein
MILFVALIVLVIAIPGALLMTRPSDPRESTNPPSPETAEGGPRLPQLLQRPLRSRYVD